jgi:hypothetical protein
MAEGTEGAIGDVLFFSKSRLLIVNFFFSGFIKYTHIQQTPILAIT